jgi:predicted nuclease with TOPRIM domain
MTDHTIVALVARRAELAGEMHTLQTRLNQIHADLSSLDDVIKQFDPDYQLATIRPRYRKQVSPGEVASISRAVLDTLRRAAEPMTAKAVAQAIMTERGLNLTDRALVRSMAKRVDMALRYQRTNGMVQEHAENGVSVVWSVVLG